MYLLKLFAVLFYENNLNSVHGERVQFLDEKGIILPSQVTIRELSTTDMKVVKESKVVNLSQIKPKQALEISIPAPNKRIKLTKEVEDTKEDNELIIQQILLKQLDK